MVGDSGKISFISGALDDYREFGKFWDPTTTGLDFEQWLGETFDFSFQASDGIKHGILTLNDEFVWIPFMDLKILSGGKHPTLKWDRVPGADHYKVRIMDPNGPGFYLDDLINDDGSDSFTYTYSGDLFSQYDKYQFRFEARQNDSATKSILVNRSVVYYEHSIATALPWIPLMLLND